MGFVVVLSSSLLAIVCTLQILTLPGLFYSSVPPCFSFTFFGLCAISERIVRVVLKFIIVGLCLKRKSNAAKVIFYFSEAQEDVFRPYYFSHPNPMLLYLAPLPSFFFFIIILKNLFLFSFISFFFISLLQCLSQVLQNFSSNCGHFQHEIFVSLAGLVYFPYLPLSMFFSLHRCLLVSCIIFSISADD